MADTPRWEPGTAPPAATWHPAPAEREVPHPLTTSAFEPMSAPTSDPVVLTEPLPDPLARPEVRRRSSRRVTAVLLAVGLLVMVGLMAGLVIMMSVLVAQQSQVGSAGASPVVVLVAA